MCLGIPGKIVRIEFRDNMKIALVDVGGGNIVEALLSMDDVKEGDYVVVHAGLVISRIREEEFYEALNLWREIIKELTQEST